MKIEHLAVWVSDLELMKAFYEKYFDAKANEIYHNPKKGFHSYFLSFEHETCRLELMARKDITQRLGSEVLGWAHLAVALGSKEKVDQLTDRLKQDGYSVKGEPRTTGDGYYESVILDPEGNIVELTV